MNSTILTIEKRIKELESLILRIGQYQNITVLQYLQELKEHRAALDILMQQPISLADVIDSVKAREEKQK